MIPADVVKTMYPNCRHRQADHQQTYFSRKAPDCKSYQNGENPKPYIKISHFNVNGLWQSFPGTCRYATFEKAQTLTCSRGYLKV
jgi:hypothetical protein